MDSPTLDQRTHDRTTDGQHWRDSLANGLPAMLTAKQASDLLQIRRPQVYALAREGIIPSVRVGRTVRFNRDRLIEWIAAGGTGLGDAE